MECLPDCEAHGIIASSEQACASPSSHQHEQNSFLVTPRPPLTHQQPPTDSKPEASRMGWEVLNYVSFFLNCQLFLFLSTLSKIIVSLCLRHSCVLPQNVMPEEGRCLHGCIPDAKPKSDTPHARSTYLLSEGIPLPAPFFQVVSPN